MKTTLPKILIAIAIAAGLAFAGAWAEGEGWDRYKPGSLRSVIDLHDLSWGEADMVLSGQQFPSRVRVVYQGKYRPLPPERGALLDAYFRMLQIHDMRDLFESEILVKEGEAEFWMPIQKALLSELIDVLENSESFTAFVIWSGGIKTEGKRTWVFCINRFDEEIKE